MMPTFPSSPLRFRTAGFPRYGSKAGLSDGAFPCGLHPSFAASVARISLALSRGCAAPCAAAVRAVGPLYPRGPRSGPGYVVPVHPHLFGPIRPARRPGAISPHRGLYAPPSLCWHPASLGRRRVVPSFRGQFLLSMSSCSSPESPSLAPTQSFSNGFAFTCLSLRLDTLVLPLQSASCGTDFRGFLVRSFATTC